MKLIFYFSSTLMKFILSSFIKKKQLLINRLFLQLSNNTIHLRQSLNHIFTTKKSITTWEIEQNISIQIIN